VQERLDRLAKKGRDPVPAEVRFTTWTLRSNRMFWIEIDGLTTHWERARVDAAIDGDAIRVTTSGVTAMRLQFDPGQAPFAPGTKGKLTIDGTSIALPAVRPDRSLTVPLVKRATWTIGEHPAGPRKMHGLTGPIDDAFMDAFVFVRPTGQPLTPALGAWAREQADYAIAEWVHVFRGEPRVRNDVDVTEDDIASRNIVLFGDPSSNAVYKRIAGRLPFRWTASGVVVNGRGFGPTSAPVFIFPNPLNPSKYVVVNSGFTFHDQSNNDMQSPKLADWAIVDIAKPGNNYAYLPLFVQTQGFFDEQWKLRWP
jgi:hypothetical protein